MQFVPPQAQIPVTRRLNSPHHYKHSQQQQQQQSTLGNNMPPSVHMTGIQQGSTVPLNSIPSQTMFYGSTTRSQSRLGYSNKSSMSGIHNGFTNLGPTTGLNHHNQDPILFNMHGVHGHHGHGHHTTTTSVGTIEGDVWTCILPLTISTSQQQQTTYGGIGSSNAYTSPSQNLLQARCNSPGGLLGNNASSTSASSSSSPSTSSSIVYARFAIGLRNSERLEISITQDADSFFLYSVSLSCEEFHSLKASQNLLVDFSAFPDKIIELLSACHSGSINSTNNNISAPSSSPMHSRPRYIFLIVPFTHQQNMISL
jgi:Centriolar protein SAS N-terminal